MEMEIGREGGCVCVRAGVGVVIPQMASVQPPALRCYATAQDLNRKIENPDSIKSRKFNPQLKKLRPNFLSRQLSGSEAG